jgi:hypothetical protein
MCDYSLHLVASRPAKVGDKLVSTNFANSMTRGFAAVGEPTVAVCLLPGTEVAFERDVIEYRDSLSAEPEARGKCGSVPADQHGQSKYTSRCA